LPGYYCTGGAGSPIQYLTPAGHYSVSGAYQATACPAGTYNQETGQSVCLDCPAGFLCASTGTINYVVCPIGSYCPANSAIPTPCPAGTYSTTSNLFVYFLSFDSCDLCRSLKIGCVFRQNSTGCTPCPASSYCGAAGLTVITGTCSAGYYCVSGASSSTPSDGVTGNSCLAGSYCPAASSWPTPCPIATINPYRTKTTAGSCIQCPAGSYCAGVGLANATGLCAAGFYCTGNATVPSPVDGITGNVCPIAFYCPAGSSAAVPCSPGSFQNETGQAVCLTSPSGMYSGQGWSSPSTCPIGAYCAQGILVLWKFLI
jgi:hypothetical protein